MSKWFRSFMTSVSLLLAFMLMMSSFVISPIYAAGADVKAYSNIPSYSLSSDITMTVDGINIPVQDNVDGVPFARFEMSGSVDVIITVNSGLTSAVIRPRALNLPYHISDNQLTFTLDKPLKFKIDMNGNKDFFIFADPPETDTPKLTDANVKNILDFSGVSNEGTLCTAGIQSAIDWIPANPDTKDTLYFPDGIYNTGSLYIKSNIKIYLSSGAMIKASSDIADYAEVYDFPPDQPHEKAFIIMNGIDNVKIFGRGVIDSNGRNFGNGGGAYGGSKVITLYSGVDSNRKGSSNLTIDDIMLTNGWFYQYFLCGATNANLTNIKAFNTCSNGNQVLNVDAFKIMCGSNISLKDAFLMGNDDVITTGADGPQADGDLHDCTIDHVTLYQTSVASLIRIAFTNRFAVHDITIKNVLSIDNWAGTVIKAENFPGYNYSHPIYNMTFENFMVEGAHHLLSWGIDNNDSTFSSFDNWLFKDISIMGASLPTTLKGTSANKKVTNFTFDNIKINGRYCRSAADANIIIDPVSTSNIVFKAADDKPFRPVSEGLIAYLNFDGNAKDTSTIINPGRSYEYDGRLSGTAASTTGSAGKFGEAFQFDGGRDNYVELDKAAVIRSNTFTNSFWIKTSDDSEGTGPNLWEKPAISGLSTWGAASNDFTMNLDRGKLAYCSGLRNSDDWQFRSDKLIADNAWHFVVAVCDGTKTQIYVDGELLSGSINDSGNYDLIPTDGKGLSGDVCWQIGNAQGLGFTGSVDDFAFWGRALTTEEIAILYNDGAGRTVLDAAKLFIEKADQTGFAFEEGDSVKPYSPAFRYTNTAGGGESGGGVTYAITGGTGAACIDASDGEITKVTKSGTLIVTATKAGDDAYNPATAVYMLTIEKATPDIITPPAASNLSVGGTLSDAALTGGAASISGRFAWTNPEQTAARSGSFDVTFMPDDPYNYNAVMGIEVSVTVIDSGVPDDNPSDPSGNSSADSSGDPPDNSSGKYAGDTDESAVPGTGDTGNLLPVVTAMAVFLGGAMLLTQKRHHTM